jgi:hypothetical protein
MKSFEISKFGREHTSINFSFIYNLPKFCPNIGQFRKKNFKLFEGSRQNLVNCHKKLFNISMNAMNKNQNHIRLYKPHFYQNMPIVSNFFRIIVSNI